MSIVFHQNQRSIVWVRCLIHYIVTLYLITITHVSCLTGCTGKPSFQQVAWLHQFSHQCISIFFTLFYISLDLNLFKPGTDLILLLIVTSSKKPKAFKLERYEIWQESLRVSMCRLTELDFWFDVTLSRWQSATMMSFHAEKCCRLVSEHEASARCLCSSILPVPVVHMSLFAFSAVSLLIGHYDRYLTCKIAAISKGSSKILGTTCWIMSMWKMENEAVFERHMLWYSFLLIEIAHQCSLITGYCNVLDATSNSLVSVGIKPQTIQVCHLCYLNPCCLLLVITTYSVTCWQLIWNPWEDYNILRLREF